MGKEQKGYSDEERAACLAAYLANGGNLKKTARQCGVPVNTLRHWVAAAERAKAAPPPGGESKEAIARDRAAGGPGGAGPGGGGSTLGGAEGVAVRGNTPGCVDRSVALLPQASALLLQKIDDILHKLADAIPGKIAEAGLSQCSTAMGTLMDKAAALRQQRAQGAVDDVAGLTDDELDRRLAEAQAALAAADRGEEAAAGAGGG